MEDIIEVDSSKDVFLSLGEGTFAKDGENKYMEGQGES